MQVIILAGGFGTRLKSVVNDIPKPMAPISGKPFLAYLLDLIIKQGVTKIVLSVGYRHEVISAYFGSLYQEVPIHYSVENEPLGTGGATLGSLQFIDSPYFFLINGDSLFNISLHELYQKFTQDSAQITLALKPMIEIDRYGTITLDADERITSFIEKKYIHTGIINAGVYCIDKKYFLKHAPRTKFSFENELLEKRFAKDIFTGYLSDAYFIDIGIPEDYQRAEKELCQIR